MKTHYGIPGLLFLLSLFSSCGEAGLLNDESGTISVQLYQNIFYAMKDCDVAEVELGLIDYSAFDGSNYKVTVLLENTVVEQLAFNCEKVAEDVEGMKNYQPGQQAALSLSIPKFSANNKDTLKIEVLLEGGKFFSSFAHIVFTDAGDTITYTQPPEGRLSEVCGSDYWPDFHGGPLTPGDTFDIKTYQVTTYLHADDRTWVELEAQGGTLRSRTTDRVYDLAPIPTTTYDIEYEVLQQQLNENPGIGEKGLAFGRATKKYHKGYSNASFLVVPETAEDYYPAFRIYCERTGVENKAVLRDCQFSEVLSIEDIMTPTQVKVTFLPKEEEINR
jgi:hypothetical protein